MKSIKIYSYFISLMFVLVSPVYSDQIPSQKYPDDFYIYKQKFSKLKLKKRHSCFYESEQDAYTGNTSLTIYQKKIYTFGSAISSYYPPENTYYECKVEASHQDGKSKWTINGNTTKIEFLTPNHKSKNVISITIKPDGFNIDMSHLSSLDFCSSAGVDLPKIIKIKNNRDYCDEVNFQ